MLDGNWCEKTLKSRSIYVGKLLTLKLHTVILANGRETEREIVESNHSVVIVALDSKDYVLLVRQYRKAAESFLLELAAGTIEAGELPIECALRELEEETGYKAGSMSLLGSFWMTPGYCTEYMYAYLAKDLKPGTVNQDDDEAIEVVKVSKSQIPQMIREGKIQDAKSIAALGMALYI
jgi:ADP-ribose pyrophosphatase